jgi:DUF4097 and DUF4098 domain-containing protein YvlB
MIRTFIRFITVLTVMLLPVPMQAQAPDIAREVQKTVHDAMRTAMAAMHDWTGEMDFQKGPEQTEKTSKSFKVGPSGTLDIGNVSGDMVITEGGGDTITVDATKRTRVAAGEAKDQFERCTVSMAERMGRVEVRVNYTGNNNRVSVDYAVTAPAGTTIIARSVSGDVRITGIRGDVRVDTVSGDITATSTPAASLLKSVSGDVVVSGVASQSDLRVSSVSGNVDLRGAKLHGLEVSSISGDLRLTDVSADNLTSSAISGDVVFLGPLARGGRYEMKSQSGDLNLTLTGTTGFELDAQTFSGNIKSDLPITLRPGEKIGGAGHKGIHGMSGDGSAQLLLKSFSGDITIGKK